MTSTYFVFMAGLVAGEIGCLVYIGRSSLLSDDEPSGDPIYDDRRQLAMRSVLIVFMLMAFAMLVVAVVIGGTAVVLGGGILVVLSGSVLLLLWPTSSLGRSGGPAGQADRDRKYTWPSDER